VEGRKCTYIQVVFENVYGYEKRIVGCASLRIGVGLKHKFIIVFKYFYYNYHSRINYKFKSIFVVYLSNWKLNDFIYLCFSKVSAIFWFSIQCTDGSRATCGSFNLKLKLFLVSHTKIIFYVQKLQKFKKLLLLKI